MTDRTHLYSTTIAWTGDRGTGTSHYRGYDRDHVLSAPGKADILMSSDPAFRGDPTRWNPEELLLAALSSCHMLWFLHLATEAGIVVRAYSDHAEGRMVETADGSGRFTEVVLRPAVAAEAGTEEAAMRLHHEAHAKCFVANSVNFLVRCEPSFEPLGSASGAPAIFRPCG